MSGTGNNADCVFVQMVIQIHLFLALNVLLNRQSIISYNPIEW